MRSTAEGELRLVIVMVGLPARGKTAVARKLQRYLSWLGYRTVVTNVGDYRRTLAGAHHRADYFDPNNRDAYAERSRFAEQALDDMLSFLRGGGQIGIYDATNTERGRRDLVHERCTAAGAAVVFVETISSNPDFVERNIRNNKLLSPDYAGEDAERAIADFRRRIAHYESTYAPVCEESRSFVKVVDDGRQVIINRMDGYFLARLAFFLMHIHPAERPIRLTRHGESLHNVEGRIGGDTRLTERGRRYARRLAALVAERNTLGDRGSVVWTSTLLRAVETARTCTSKPVVWRALDEIDAGVCDGLTYAEIAARWPEEAEARQQDKLHYRYPRGESYHDVIARLEPLIVDLEQQRSAVLVVSHQGVLRVLYGYLMGIPQERCPHIDIPLHTLIELTPTEPGYQEQRFCLDDPSVPPAIEPRLGGASS